MHKIFPLAHHDVDRNLCTQMLFPADQVQTLDGGSCVQHMEVGLHPLTIWCPPDDIHVHSWMGRGPCLSAPELTEVDVGWN
jgi:hypothetical protein